jgi:hypothetical protein
MIFGTDVALRALGAALAGLSIMFAAYMLADGGYKVRINGMEHLAIFAQPRGAAPAKPEASPVAAPPLVLPPLDMTATGSFTPAPDPPSTRRPVEAVAVRADRAWLLIDGVIRVAVPGDDVPRLGHIAKIAPRDGGWALLDDKGAVLLTVARQANGAAMFSRGMIFK